jgi:D-cysteine desulfhydrase
LDNGAHFWVKDDGGCSKVYGGNKLRKLEYLLAGARQAERRVLVVHGDVESHTVQACGFLGQGAGFEVHAVVFPYRDQTFWGPELEGLRRAGVCVHRQKTMLTTILHAYWIGWRKKATVVPLGASTPLATLGYVRAALELLAQVRQGVLPEPRRIFLPFATGGSVAGLLIGLALGGASTRVVAVRTVEGIVANRRRLERLMKRTLELLRLGHRDFERCLQHLELIDNSHLGRGFRDVPMSTATAVAVAAGLGLRLEPVFSGKAFASLLQSLPGSADGELLFWNTHDHHGEPGGAGDIR